MFNRTTLLILLVALATGAGLMAAEHVFDRNPAQASAPPLKAVRLMSTPRVLPDFALQQSDRTQLLPGELRGHWTVVFIGFLAARILVGAFNVLTDRAVLPPEQVSRVVLEVPGVRHCRDVRTRGSHEAVYVDLVAHVDGDLTLRKAHEVADRIETALQQAHPKIVDVVVHLEPADGS